jgi:hypothetical protein
MSENERKGEEILAQLPELEMLCRLCGGEGVEYAEGRQLDCGLCHGAGYEPTAFGRKVLALMSHNFRSMYNAE